MLESTPLPPGPRPWVALQNVLPMRRDMLGFFTAVARKYGGVAHIDLGARRIYLVTEPELIQDVLVTHHRSFSKSWVLRMGKRVVGEGLLTSEGDFHRRQRKLIQPAFHPKHITDYGTTMIDFARALGEGWEEGRCVDMAHEMMGVTLSVVAKTLFDADVAEEAQDIARALTEIFGLYTRATLPFAKLLDHLPLPSNRRISRARARLDEIMYRIVAERRATGENRGDLLSMLLAAQDEDDGGTMTDKQVRDEALTLFLAGHETTAIALTWTWYLLSENPEVEAKLHREIGAVLGDRLPTVEDLPRLEYTAKVLRESVRIYPPAYTISREALHDYPLREFVVPAGDVIVMPQYVVHRDPRFYEQPLHFIPDRWTPDFLQRLPRFAYFPFGGGPRVCIGEGFAWMEGILILATLARHWRARHVPGHPVVPHPFVTLRPRYGMQMTLHRVQ